jgi:hypothetical protein
MLTALTTAAYLILLTLTGTYLITPLKKLIAAIEQDFEKDKQDIKSGLPIREKKDSSPFLTNGIGFPRDFTAAVST